MFNLNNVYGALVEYGVATESEIDLVTDVSGWNEKTFELIIYSRLALNNIEQFAEEYSIEIEDLQD